MVNVLIDRRKPKVRHDVFKGTLRRYVAGRAIVDPAVAALQFGEEGEEVHPVLLDAPDA